jgi:hypothetical protein
MNASHCSWLQSTARLGLGFGLVGLLSQCSMLGSLTGAAGDAAKASRGCPDVGTLEAAGKVDFAEEFSLDAATAGKVKAGVIAAADLNRLSASIDADLKDGCGGLAKDLGATANFKTGPEACKLAVKTIGEARAKVGASAAISVTVSPPVCAASLDSMFDCAGKCDANLKAGKADVKCEGGELSGKCGAQCTGSCELSAAASCSGTCDGSCDASFSGTCGGTCEGTCDSRATNGACAGTCDGKCSAKAKGTCGGKCEGTCELASAGSCAGTCTGSCSVDFQEPKCTGKIVPPSMSPECKASCDAHASASLSCSPPKVAVGISGATDTAAAARYQAALEKNLPRIVKISAGIGPKLADVLVNSKTTLEGGISAGKAIASSRPTAGARVALCLLDPFKGAVSAVADIQASVSVSVEVNAEATASAKSGEAVAASGS